MPPFILAFLLGLIAGLRAVVALAAVSWAAYFGHLPVAGTHFAFMGHIATPIILTVIAAVELAYEKTPRSAGSTTFVPKLIFRIALGGLSGAVIGSSNQTNALFVCAAFGVFGALAGTFGSTVLYEQLRARIKRDGSASIAEDAIAVLACLLVLIRIR
ncbi:MAG: DUF4126 domain-containing protein [Acidobacteriaceae bacterium]